MTLEERNQAIDFIVASQARLAATEEQDREWLRRLADAQTISTNLLKEHSQLFKQHTDMMVHHSERMDRMDSVYREALAKNTVLQEEALRLLKQALHMLNMILDRLPPPIR